MTATTNRVIHCVSLSTGKDSSATACLALATQPREALRTGTASRVNFAGICTYCELGLAIERHGVVRGLAQHLTQAEQVLKAIKARCDLPTGWKPPVLNWQEMEILAELRTLHFFQLQQLSYAEYQRAWRDMLNHVQRDGGEVIQEQEAA